MVLVLSPGYNSDSSNSYGFIHMRVKSYQKNNVDVQVFVLDEKETRSYIFDGVVVNIGSAKDFVCFVKVNDVNIICVHFIDIKMIRAINNAKRRFKLFVFIHGNEALMWYERIFPYMFSSFRTALGFFNYSISNMISMPQIRHFFRNTICDYTWIGVSNWMLDIAKKNWKCKLANCKVIPNIIDGDVFNYIPKDSSQRYKFLTIRSFNSGKYGNDIIVNIILKLAQYSEFKQMEFLIVGDGYFYDKLTDKVKQFPNVELRKGFIPYREISRLHKEYGIFLCPTRQDAQGVSMCEAMSSGLIPITSNNTAIPEFVPMDSGLACDSEEEMVQRILDIVRDEKLFQQLSEEMAKFISNKCSSSKTTEIELALIHDAMKTTNNF